MTPGLVGLAAATGLAVGPINPVLAVLLQDRTPAHLRGRVVSTTWSLSLLVSPLGVLGAGFLLEAAGPGTALLVIGAGCLLTCGYAAATPGLRGVDAGARTSGAQVVHDSGKNSADTASRVSGTLGPRYQGR